MMDINLLPHVDEIYWRRKYVELDEDKNILQATADRRLELLKWYERNAKECIFCGGILIWAGVEETKPPENVGHSDDCPLSKELHDAARGSEDG